MRAVADESMALAGLEGVAATPAGRLPTGQARVLELVRTLARGPRVLLLDEPSSGLDPKESAELGAFLVRITRERHLGVLLVEHDMDLVLRICDWIEVLNFGRALMGGTPEEVWASPAVQDAYLGAPQPV
jgi:ABC-type branched-subunit amino acid transport system ATPase component